MREPLTVACRNFQDHYRDKKIVVASGMGADCIVVYLRRRLRRGDPAIPSEWQGWPVKVSVSGPIYPLANGV